MYLFLHVFVSQSAVPADPEVQDDASERNWAAVAQLFLVRESSIQLGVVCCRGAPGGALPSPLPPSIRKSSPQNKCQRSPSLVFFSKILALEKCNIAELMNIDVVGDHVCYYSMIVFFVQGELCLLVLLKCVWTS